MKACFIGHRSIKITNTLITLLENTVENLIIKGVTTFLFGSMSDFDDLSLNIVTKLKQKYPFVKRVYVRSSYQFIDDNYTNYLLKFYDETYFPPEIENAGKYSYVKRNYKMIDNSYYCVFYYNENYIPETKRNTSVNSGTKIAYTYAIKKKKEVINLFKLTIK